MTKRKAGVVYVWRDRQEEIRCMAPTMTCPQMAEHFRVDPATMCRMVKRLGISAKPVPRRGRVDPIDHPSAKMILRELESGPATKHDLAEAVGIGIKQVNWYMEILHNWLLVSIAGYEPKRCVIWKLGLDRDVVWRRVSVKKSKQRYREKKRLGTQSASIPVSTTERAKQCT